MNKILIISGSPKELSQTDAILHYFKKLLEIEILHINYINIQSILTKDLTLSEMDSPAILSICEEVRAADGIIIGSPVYKSSYSGVLKTLLDILPKNAFKQTPVLPIMIGDSISHCFALEYTLKPLIVSLNGISEQGVFAIDRCIDTYDLHHPLKDTDIQQRLTTALDCFITNVQKANKLIM